MKEGQLLTTENLEKGFVDVTVERLDGRPLKVRMNAPGWRRRRELILEFQRTLDAFVFLRECLKDEKKPEALLDQLIPDSVAQLENYAVALVCGESYQKKMAAAGREVMKAMITANGSAPNVT